MMGRTTLVTVLALAGATSAFAQGMHTATGNNPLERISGADYAGNGSLGRTNVMPSYSSRQGVQDVNGGRGGQGFNYQPALGGNGVDPRTGQNITDSRNNPFLYPYSRSPGGLPNASGIFAGVNTGAYYTPTAGSYYYGGGANNSYGMGGLGGYGGGYGYGGIGGIGGIGGGYGYGGVGSSMYGLYGGYGQSARATAGFGTMANGYNAGQAYPFGISSYGMASSSLNPMLGAYGYGNPMYGAGGYGAGYPYGYGYGYQGVRRLVPGLVGAGVGALVGRHFGMIGLLAGGVGGFLVGSFLGNQARQLPFSGLYDNQQAMMDTYYGNQYSYYRGIGDYYGNRNGPNVGPLAGVAGAALGAMVGKMGGLPGMLIGGVVGFIGGNLVGRMLFPQSAYGGGYGSYGYGYNYDPYNNVGNFRNANLPGGLGNNTVAVRPYSPNAPLEDSLGRLRDAYFRAVRAVEDAGKRGDNNARSRAETELRGIEAQYRQAQQRGLGR